MKINVLKYYELTITFFWRLKKYFGTENIWAKGHYTNRTELIVSVIIILK